MSLKQVSVEVKGLHQNSTEQGEVACLVPGTLQEQDGKRIVCYTEPSQDGDIGVDNTLCLEGDRITLEKRGAVAWKCVFQEGTSYQSLYQTPFGPMQLEVETKSIRIFSTEDSLRIRILYALSIEGGEADKTQLSIKVSKKKPEEMEE